MIYDDFDFSSGKEENNEEKNVVSLLFEIYIGENNISPINSIDMNNE